MLGFWVSRLSCIAEDKELEKYAENKDNRQLSQLKFNHFSRWTYHKAVCEAPSTLG